MNIAKKPRKRGFKLSWYAREKNQEKTFTKKAPADMQEKIGEVQKSDPIPYVER